MIVARAIVTVVSTFIELEMENYIFVPNVMKAETI